MSDTELFKCMTCQMICPSEANLAQHMAVYHGSRPVQFIKGLEHHFTQNQMNPVQVSYPVFSVAIPSGTFYPVTMLSPSTSDIRRQLQMPNEPDKLLAKELPTEHEINQTAMEVSRLLQCPHCSIVCSSNEMFVSHLRVHASVTEQNRAKLTSTETQSHSKIAEKISFQTNEDYWKEAFDIIPCSQTQTIVQPTLATPNVSAQAGDYSLSNIRPAEEHIEGISIDRGKIEIFPVIKISPTQESIEKINEQTTSSITSTNEQNNIPPLLKISTLQEYAGDTVQEESNEVETVNAIPVKETMDISCSICDVKCKDMSEYTNHLQVHSGNLNGANPSQSSSSEKQPFKCSYCNLVCGSKAGLARHTKTHKKHPSDCSYPCKICGIKFPTSRTRTLHMRSLHQKAFPCDSCSQSFPSKTALKRHCKVNHPAIEYQCTQCEKFYEEESSLKAHIRLAHCYMTSKNGTLTCDICKESFEYEATLQQHYKQHMSPKRFKCAVCAAKFLYNSQLMKHMRSHIEDRKNIRCSICEEWFSSRIELRMHKTIHPEITAFNCPECDATFSYKAGLRAHRLTHLKVKSHACDLCTKTFTSWSLLSKHRSTHIRKFSCRICGKTYPSAYKLKVHRFVHSGKTNYKCPSCSESFLRIVDFNRHVERTHPEQFVKCDICPALFTSEIWMKRHRIVHNGKFR